MKIFNGKRQTRQSEKMVKELSKWIVDILDSNSEKKEYKVLVVSDKYNNCAIQAKNIVREVIDMKNVNVEAQYIKTILSNSDGYVIEIKYKTHRDVTLSDIANKTLYDKILIDDVFTEEPEDRILVRVSPE